MIIPHSRPSFDQAEIDAVTRVIKSGQLSQGPEVSRLEEYLSGHIGQKHAVCVSSGLTALFLALKALDIKPGNEVIIPAYTCSALWHAVKAVGATPVFADIDPVTHTLSIETVKPCIKNTTKGIIFPHMFGQPGDIIAIMQLGIPVIEDIAQAIGTVVQNHPAGYYGTLAVMSFYTTKYLGAGEGGAILTNSYDLKNKILNCRDYDEKDELALRFNAKMTDITAAIVIEQFKKLQFFLDRRKEIAHIYSKFYEGKITIPATLKDENHPNYYRFIIDTDCANETIKKAEKDKITFRKPVFKSLHLYKNELSLPITEELWKREVSVPIFPDLKENEINRICQVLSDKR